MKKLSIFAPLAAACVFALALSGSTQAPTEPLAVGTIAPDYKLKDARTGRIVNLHSLKGRHKAIYLDFFASWCGPCQVLIPGIIDLHKEAKDDGLLVVGVNVWDTWDGMHKNISEKDIPYLVLHDETGRGEGNLAGKFGVRGIPTVFILDGRTMEIKGHWVGANPAHKAAEREALRKLGVSLK